MTSREWAVSIDTELPADELDPVRDHELDSLTEKLSGVTVGGRPYRLGATLFGEVFTDLDDLVLDA